MCFRETTPKSVNLPQITCTVQEADTNILSKSDELDFGPLLKALQLRSQLRQSLDGYRRCFDKPRRLGRRWLLLGEINPEQISLSFQH